MFEVLVYMFEHYLGDDYLPDQEILIDELSAAGFDSADISNAFEWFRELDELSDQLQTAAPEQANSLRVFVEAETQKISLEGISFITYLQSAGIFTSAQRELVIDRAMALPQIEVGIDEVRWIVLMALTNLGDTRDYLFVEDAVFGDIKPTLH